MLFFKRTPEASTTVLASTAGYYSIQIGGLAVVRMTVSQEGVGEHRISARLPWHNVVFRRVERSGTPIPGSEFTMLAIGQGHRDQDLAKNSPLNPLFFEHVEDYHTRATHAQHTRKVRTQCVEKWREYGQMNCLN